MNRRFLLATLAAFALVLTLAATALAKEGAVAVMDTPIPPDAEPGTEIEVGWTAWTMDGDERLPIVGSPLVLTIAPAGGGEVIEVAGTETPGGSGHYVGKFIAPAGGIAAVTLGMRGTGCDDSGCRRVDVPLTFVEDPLAAATGSGATGNSAPPVSAPILVAVLGLAGLVAAAVMLVAARRPRPVASRPSGG